MFQLEKDLKNAALRYLDLKAKGKRWQYGFELTLRQDQN
jgi:hypothetical protein